MLMIVLWRAPKTAMTESRMPIMQRETDR